jgi:hypothetical protein
MKITQDAETKPLVVQCMNREFVLPVQQLPEQDPAYIAAQNCTADAQVTMENCESNLDALQAQLAKVTQDATARESEIFASTVSHENYLKATKGDAKLTALTNEASRLTFEQRRADAQVKAAQAHYAECCALEASTLEAATRKHKTALQRAGRESVLRFADSLEASVDALIECYSLRDYIVRTYDSDDLGIHNFFIPQSGFVAECEAIVKTARACVASGSPKVEEIPAAKLA